MQKVSVTVITVIMIFAFMYTSVFASSESALLPPIQSDEADAAVLGDVLIHSLTPEDMTTWELHADCIEDYEKFDINNPLHRRIVERYWEQVQQWGRENGVEPTYRFKITWEIAPRIIKYPGMNYNWEPVGGYAVITLDTLLCTQDELLSGSLLSTTGRGTSMDIFPGGRESVADYVSDNTIVDFKFDEYGGAYPYKVGFPTDTFTVYAVDMPSASIIDSFNEPWDINNPYHQRALEVLLKSNAVSESLLVDKDLNEVEFSRVPIDTTLGIEYENFVAKHSNSPSISYLVYNGNEDFFNQLLIALIKSITNADMTDLKKLESVYEFIAGSYNYLNERDGKAIDISIRPEQANLGKIIDVNRKYGLTAEELSGYDLLYYGEGDCTNYAGLLTCMAKVLGFEASYVSGRYISPDGSQTAHAWTKIAIDGVDYYFDAQIESSNWQRNRDNENYNPRGWWMQPVDSEQTQSRYIVGE